VKIKAIEPIAISLPMKKPVQMAGETVSRADNVLVRVEADNGVVGWGEAASAPTMTGETVASMMAAVELLALGLRGHLADDFAADCFAAASAEMDARMYGNAGAKAAIEMALHDLVGRATHRPVHALLGGKLRSTLPLLAIVGSEDAAADLRDAEARWASGYRTFKIKVGIVTPQADAERTRFVCAALKRKGDCLVSSDANQGFTVDGALDYVRRLGDCGLDFFEQPVAAHDLAGMARVAAATPVAIGADEGIHSLADLERNRAQGVRGGSLKAIKLGGLRAMLEACRLCDRTGMNVNIACKTGESSLASAAALHVAAVAPAVAWGLSLTSGGLAEDTVVEPLRLAGGHANVPDGPGLGVDVDEHRVRHRAQDFKRVA
jgi:L-alanine-DL-glutamate epimerase-like enolase superfamily enzyme